MKYIWLIPLLPGIGAAINGLIGIRAFSRKAPRAVACTTMLAALGLSLVAFWQLLGLPPDARAFDVTVAPWIPAIPLQVGSGAIGSFQVPWGFRLDPLSGMMLLVVTGIGTLIHVYSTAYIADEPRGGVARFFCYLNLFCFFMLMLVLGNNFLVMFVGWEGVGLCSYLLIGYWYEKKSASDAGKKAFITNRIGDWGFILGIFLIFSTFGTLDFRAVQNAAATMPVETGFGVLSLICLLLFIGATGKSAQIPLFVWLPDAMEGPTPVSALIHAATMVTAGVYMVGRNAVLFSHAPLVMDIVAIIGVLTALMAASIGLVQYDIKRVLAYSTVSQLGYMFTAMGVGAFSAGAFHLMTHAFFKALLFLGSGSVIHAMAGEQDMRRMGGLKKYMPTTYMTMFIGTLAIAGIPPLSGFFSKDEILYHAFLHNKAVWVLAVITAMMTAFYMFRLIAMTFFGAYRGPAWETVDPASAAIAAGHGARHPADPLAHGQAIRKDHEVTHGPPEPHDHAADGGDAHGGHGGHGHWHGPHESPSAMTLPLMALAAGAIVAGFVGIPAALGGNNAIEHFLEPSFTAHAVAGTEGAVPGGEARAEGGAAASEAGAEGAAEGSRAVELGLMGFSVLIAVIGIGLAWKFYVTSPETSGRLAERFAGAHRVLSHKYYVDELYGATVIAATWKSARALWTVDRNVVDGAVNGTGRVTLISSWLSGLTDKRVVDGLVNLVGWVVQEGSHVSRRLQTGLVQNYALLMLFGVFAFVSLYLFVR
jgi:NADH-quinone oxidoreductase subunit L